MSANSNNRSLITSFPIYNLHSGNRARLAERFTDSPIVAHLWDRAETEGGKLLPRDVNYDKKNVLTRGRIKMTINAAAACIKGWLAVDIK